MNYEKDYLFWENASIRITEVKHGLLIKKSTAELFENNVLLFVCGKSGRIQIKDTPYILRSNCMFHIARNTLIMIDAADCEVEYYVVAYQAELLPNIGRLMMADILQNGLMGRCFAVQATNSAFFRTQLLYMADAWKRNTPADRFRAKKIFYDVIDAFYYELETKKAPDVAVDVFEKARQYLQTHYTETNSVQTLADALGVARSSLHEQFKRNIGLSPQQYIMQLRLDHACSALLENHLSIDEIAACCGLRDKCYFSRVFKQKYGISPGAYRKALPSSEHSEQRHAVPIRLPSVPAETGYTLIENFGRIHRYYGVPRRIVCLDYSAAEICAALGVVERLVGVASAEGSLGDCMEIYRDVIAAVPFLPGKSLEHNVPSHKAVCDCKPDLVIGTSYSFSAHGGIANAEDFEQLGIHIYALKATYQLGSTFVDTYEDITNLGRILGVESSASDLIERMKAQENELAQHISENDPPIRVFSFDSSILNKAFTCGQSLESHMIRSAGGRNIFEDRMRQFASVEWDEVAKANPQAIIIHCFHDAGDGGRKLDLLKRISEIAETDAMRNGNIYIMGIKRIFPGIDNVETTISLAKWLNSIRTEVG